MTPGSREFDVLRVRDGDAARSAPAAGVREHVVVEEPLEIRLDGEPLAVTMRTPGHDAELAVGFLVTEGIVPSPAAIATAAHCDENENVVEVRTAEGAAVEPPEPRRFYSTSSCGVCGKATIDAVRVNAPHLGGDATRITPSLLSALPARLREVQELFDATGALHAAGLFDADGRLVCAREDVGRHNAVDKLVGWAAIHERSLAGHVLVVSGRAGFEIVQKAAVARIPIVAAISGPSSLAIDLARECGLTLVAFLRGGTMNVCSAPERVTG
ncbi:MAG: formate dehydrogenase accessory sulfurtransferase FdhD [Deltaproteobacteria bacterium]|nr:formate dehydrogenase accessory sulfurtransferase FdhD [Deltaproteobacteria bacterium]